MTDEIFRARGVRLSRSGSGGAAEINFALGKGEALGVCGPSCSGKSAILDIISGKARPAAGYIFVNGKLAREGDRGLRISSVGIGASLRSDMKVWEHIAIFRSGNSAFRFFSGKSIRKMVSAVFHDYDIDMDLERNVSMLDKQEIFLFSLIKARLEAPDIILIDDFALSCSPPLQARIKGLIERFKSEGISIVITSNRPEYLAPYSDRIIITFEGGTLHNFDRFYSPQNVIDIIIRNLHPLTSADKTDGKTDKQIFRECGKSTEVYRINISEQTGISPKSIPFYSGRCVCVSCFDENIQRQTKRIILNDTKKGKLNEYNKLFSEKDKAPAVALLEPQDLLFCTGKLSVIENIVLGLSTRISKTGFIDRKALRLIENDFTAWYGKEIQRDTGDERDFSGQDKMAIALYRVIMFHPDIVICIEPSSVLDNISDDIFARFIEELTQNGAAVGILASSFEHLKFCRGSGYIYCDI